MEMEQMRYNTSEFLAELEMIQACINRMAANSKTMKTYALVSTFIGLFLYPRTYCYPAYCCVWVALIGVLWALDAYYLGLELAYRGLYNHNVEKRLNGDGTGLYDLDPSMYLKDISFGKVAFSVSVLPFYAVLIGILVVCPIACLLF